MVRVALFRQQHSIRAHGDVSKDGVGKIVDAIGVSGIVGIGVGQIGLQTFIPSGRVGQTHLDLKPQFVQIIVIVRGWDGKRDGLGARQGGLKRHLSGGFIAIIHIGYIKQIERHDGAAGDGRRPCPRYASLFIGAFFL